MSDVAAVEPKASKRKSKSVAKAEPNSSLKSVKRASMLLKHASDASRLQILLSLNEGEKHVGALALHLGQSQPAVSHHLAILRHGGIIEPRRDGKNNFYMLTNLGGELVAAARTLVRTI